MIDLDFSRRWLNVARAKAALSRIGQIASIHWLDDKVELVSCELNLGNTLECDVIGADVDHGVGSGVGVTEHVLYRGKSESRKIEDVVGGRGGSAADLEVGYDVLAEVWTEHEGIAAAAAGQDIVACSPDNRVVAIAAADAVAARAAVEAGGTT